FDRAWRAPDRLGGGAGRARGGERRRRRYGAGRPAAAAGRGADAERLARGDPAGDERRARFGGLGHDAHAVTVREPSRDRTPPGVTPFKYGELRGPNRSGPWHRPCFADVATRFAGEELANEETASAFAASRRLQK